MIINSFPSLQGFPSYKLRARCHLDP